MSVKNRLRWLLKIGQNAVTVPATNTNPATIPGEPTAVDIPTYFPSISMAWGAANLRYIQQVTSILNQSIFVLSQGQMDFNKLRVAQFNVDTSKYPDAILRSVIKFAQQFYFKVLTNNNQVFIQEVDAERRKELIAQLVQYINSSNIPGGTVNNFLRTKIGGNLKELLLSILNLIK